MSFFLDFDFGFFLFVRSFARKKERVFSSIFPFPFWISLCMLSFFAAAASFGILVFCWRLGLVRCKKRRERNRKLKKKGGRGC